MDRPTRHARGYGAARMWHGRDHARPVSRGHPPTGGNILACHVTVFESAPRIGAGETFKSSFHCSKPTSSTRCSGLGTISSRWSTSRHCSISPGAGTRARNLAERNEDSQSNPDQAPGNAPGEISEPILLRGAVVISENSPDGAGIGTGFPDGETSSETMMSPPVGRCPRERRIVVMIRSGESQPVTVTT